MKEKRKGEPRLIPEPVPLRRERRGGGVNLIFTALLLEAARMADEGLDIRHIEEAARKAFAMEDGFLARMEEIGIEKVIRALEALADDSDPEDPLFRNYHNFFSPPAVLFKKLEAFRRSGEPGALRWGEKREARPETVDIMLVDVLAGRFRAVAFSTSVEVVEAGMLELREVDPAIKKALRWKEGPFAMMNRLGIGEVMRMVTEKMELSHRREINYPIPRLLISQVQKNEPWPLNSGMEAPGEE